jgi:hypothetical protein
MFQMPYSSQLTITTIKMNCPNKTENGTLHKWLRSQLKELKWGGGRGKRYERTYHDVVVSSEDQKETVVGQTSIIFLKNLCEQLILNMG